MPRHAVIVGNSDGIGLALTRRLLDEGWTVTGLSRSPGPDTHERYDHHVIDVTAPHYPATIAAAIDQGVDVCVYAAGVGEALDVTDLAAQTRAIEVNLTAAARTAEVALPRMIRAGCGHLVVLSSLADVLTSPDAPGYAASKAGLSSYFKGLAAAAKPHGVRVTTVRFGFVDTKMAKGPLRPMMLTTGKAVDVLMRCLRDRPTVVSRPRRLAALVRVIRTLRG
jgi:NAD(P)-dependent dehydrogenase (short-subunit alcohol dehydrogenase family)